SVTCVQVQGRASRVTPSPPRSKRSRTACLFGPVGEREGVRGKEVSRSAGPLTPSLSPTTQKGVGGSMHSDRGGEGVTRPRFLLNSVLRTAYPVPNDSRRERNRARPLSPQ